MAMLFIEDFFFYWVHRILHTPFLYKTVHKVHHEFDFTIAYMTLYCHWIEFLMGDMFPVSTVMFIFKNKIHVFTIAMYASYSIIKTHHMHSGYKFKIFPTTPPLPNFIKVVTPEAHNFHHTKNIGNFSTGIFLWEKLFRSNSAYQKSIAAGAK